MLPRRLAGCTAPERRSSTSGDRHRKTCAKSERRAQWRDQQSSRMALGSASRRVQMPRIRRSNNLQSTLRIECALLEHAVEIPVTFSV